LNLILFGFQNSGKSRFGQMAARKMEMRFIDTDRMIEELYFQKNKQKAAVRAIFESVGPSMFRELERESILTLKGVLNAVISIGGSAMLDFSNREILESLGKCVYLHVSKETLKVRTLSSGHLPVYLDRMDPLGSFEKVYEERKPIYEGILAEWVNTEGKSEEQIVEILCAIIEAEETASGE
jgi:shikimate kinase